MNQSSVIAGSLLGGFILYLAVKDRLVLYKNVLFGSQSSAPAQASQTNTSAATTNPAATVAATPASTSASTSATSVATYSNPPSAAQAPNNPLSQAFAPMSTALNLASDLGFDDGNAQFLGF